MGILSFVTIEKGVFFMSKKKRNIIIAIMVSMFLAAFEGTVVTTAMPTIAKSLNGYNLMSWVFSSYLLTSAISTPIYGKMSDLYGRKKNAFYWYSNIFNR